MKNACDLYVGEKGTGYFANHFDESLTFGRQYQSRYFKPYCRPEFTILDFGCGEGSILRSVPGRRKLGVDINEACGRRIRSLNPREAVPIELFQQIETVPNAVADLAISNHCLEHVPAPIDALSEIRRALHAGARLVLVTPFDDWRSPLHRTWSADDIDQHLHTWSPRNLANLVSEAGFEVERAEVFTCACSRKLFWIHHRFGERPFAAACYLLGLWKIKREIRVVARKRGRIFNPRQRCQSQRGGKT